VEAWGSNGEAAEEGLGGVNQEIGRRRFSYGGKDYTGDGQSEHAYYSVTV
jgi:hypothetical protein